MYKDNKRLKTKDKRRKTKDFFNLKLSDKKETSFIQTTSLLSYYIEKLFRFSDFQIFRFSVFQFFSFSDSMFY